MSKLQLPRWWWGSESIDDGDNGGGDVNVDASCGDCDGDDNSGDACCGDCDGDDNSGDVCCGDCAGDGFLFVVVTVVQVIYLVSSYQFLLPPTTLLGALPNMKLDH